MKIVLANRDYKTHMTDEGDQLQEGLAFAGWKLCGYGYDGITDVKKILKEYDPEFVFVQDVRDWDENSGGCFDKRVSFQNIEELKNHRCKVITVLKDAGSVKDFQKEFIEERIDADLVLHYYHENTVFELNPYMKDRLTHRIYHTVDSNLLTKIPTQNERQGALISGAIGPEIYPIRDYMTKNHQWFGLCRIPHPGYHNLKRYTGIYLDELMKFRVSVATCSAWNFALRKIIESVACGCICVTNLPEWDVLPAIDRALVRINEDMTFDEIKDLIAEKVEGYRTSTAMYGASMAQYQYDFRLQGVLNSSQIGGKLTCI